MGQQQLLLLVLGIVIVGLAVVTGIESFNDQHRKAQLDRHSEAAVTMAGKIIAWAKTPAAMGGGGGVPDWTTFSVESIGLGPAVESSTYSYVDDMGYRRLVWRTSATTPIVHVHTVPWQNARGTLIQVAIWGPDDSCLSHQTAIWDVGANAFQRSAEHVNPDPDNCSW
ncbi:MAG: hypothetical protein AAF624_04955 [Bacteroidota bacterium]